MGKLLLMLNGRATDLKSSLPPELVNSFEKEQKIKDQSSQSDPRNKQNELRDDVKRSEIKRMEQVNETTVEKSWLKISEENYFEDDFTPPQLEVRSKPIVPSLKKPGPKSSLPPKVINSFEKEQRSDNQFLQPEPKIKQNKLGDDEKQGDDISITSLVKRMEEQVNETTTEKSESKKAAWVPLENLDCVPLIAVFENDLSSTTKQDEEVEVPDYEKKRLESLENIAEKKTMFKCSKCLSEFMKKAEWKSHQCFKCDLCNKYFKATLNNQSFFKHDRNEHGGYFTKKSKMKRPARKKKNTSRYQSRDFEEETPNKQFPRNKSSDYEEKLPNKQFPRQNGDKKQNLVKYNGYENEQNTRSEPKKAKVDYEKKRKDKKITDMASAFGFEEEDE